MAKAAPEEEREKKLERREHPPESYVGTAPYFDEELKVPQGREHRRTVYSLGPVLEMIAEEAGLTFLSDHPIWYLHPETDEQKAYYGDLVLARPVDVTRITAADLLMVIEVVTTTNRKKEVKDTVFQRAVNEYNGVPELGLIFPDVEDGRSMTWFELDAESGRYTEVTLSPGSAIEPRALPGLEIRVKPRSEWRPGKKLELYYRGQRRYYPDEDRARAEQEAARAEQADARAEKERRRAEELEAKLKELGIDPTS